MSYNNEFQGVYILADEPDFDLKKFKKALAKYLTEECDPSAYINGSGFSYYSSYDMLESKDRFIDNISAWYPSVAFIITRLGEEIDDVEKYFIKGTNSMSVYGKMTFPGEKKAMKKIFGEEL